jgi:hypothetical protein
MTDNSKTYTSVIDTEVYDNGMDYLDINIYVKCPDGSEWRRTLSMNKKRRDGWSSVDCYAASKDDLFDEAAKVPPDVVRIMFGERWEEAIALLKAEYARQTDVKDHAEEMLEVLKGVYVGLRDLICDPNAQDLKSLRDYAKHTIDKVEGRK